MRRIQSFQFALWFIIAACGGCQEPAEPAVKHEPAAPATRILARLNGERILENEFRVFLGFTQGELNEDPNPAPRAELFHDFLNRKLLLQEARNEDIRVEQSEVDRYVTDWTTSVEQVSPDLADHIRDFLVTQKFLHQKVQDQLKVTLGEMLLYYEQHAETYIIDDQAHVIEILTDERPEIESLRSMLSAGDLRTFKSLAQERSKGLTASLGGDLGFFQRGDLPEEFERTIFALKPGEISSPFQSGHGFHLFFLEEWIPRHAQKFHEVRQQIFEEIMAQKERRAVHAFLNQLMKKASIEIYEPSLVLGAEETTLDDEING